MSQIHNVFVPGSYNRATKQRKPDVLVARFSVSRKRKHGRPRNVGPVTRIKRLPVYDCDHCRDTGKVMNETYGAIQPCGCHE